MIDKGKPHLKVFLCHASGDKPEVLQLYKSLVAEGIDAWLDKEKLLPGQDWRLEIPRAVHEADVVVVCLSKKSVTKEGYIQREIQFALDIAEEKPEGTIFLIPARLEDCVVPDRLSRWQWVELFEEGGFLRLLRSLKLRAEKVGAVVEPIQYENGDDDTERRLNQLYTEGLAALYTSDWDKACHRFQTILSERPNHKNAAIKLAEAERQKSLERLYAQATDAYRSENWPETIKTLDELLQKSTDYKDAPQLYRNAKKQQRLAELYSEARTLHGAQKWQAVLNAFEQIFSIEPAYPDPENLFTSAQKELVELKRVERLNELYSQAVYDMDDGHWHEARQKLETIHKSQLGFLETERLLKKVEVEIARVEERVRQKNQINILYEQAHGDIRSSNWRKALQKIEEIKNLDEQFVDDDGIAEQANARLKLEEEENQRQNELAAMYADARRFVKEEKYQAALEKWTEIHSRDSSFPDRQKVQETAKRGLKRGNKSTPVRPSPSNRTLAIVGGSVLLVITLVIVSLIWRQNSSFTSQVASVTRTPTSPVPTASLPGGRVIPAVVVTKSPTRLPPSATPVYHEALISTGVLQIGQEILSVNHRYSFKFQLDGDLVVYDNAAGKSLWSSNTKGSQANHLVMQNDGHLVLLTKDDSVVWASDITSTQGDYFLLMQDDGNLVIYHGQLHNEAAVPIWATHTNQ